MNLRKIFLTKYEKERFLNFDKKDIVYIGLFTECERNICVYSKKHKVYFYFDLYSKTSLSSDSPLGIGLGLLGIGCRSQKDAKLFHDKTLDELKSLELKIITYKDFQYWSDSFVLILWRVTQCLLIYFFILGVIILVLYFCK